MHDTGWENPLPSRNSRLLPRPSTPDTGNARERSLTKAKPLPTFPSSQLQTRPIPTRPDPEIRNLDIIAPDKTNLESPLCSPLHLLQSPWILPPSWAKMES